jgi:Predicted DNA-binding proteins
MARGPKCRRVEFVPKITAFKPNGIPLSQLEEVVLKLEELEAIRLKDQLMLEQEECAERMGVSRPTFQRILMESRAKIAAALIEGKAIRFEGGNYCLGQDQCRKNGDFHKRSNDCIYREQSIDEPEAGAIIGTKIAICSGSDSPSDPVDGRFGRCAYFMLWDDEENTFDVIKNSGSNLNQGAGTGAARELIKRGAGVLLCNRIGPRAFTVFEKAGVKIYTVGEGMDTNTALELYRAEKLTPLKAANI